MAAELVQEAPYDGARLLRTLADFRAVGRSDIAFGGPVVSVVHRGSYDTVAAAYELLLRSVSDAGGQPAGAPWESYLDEPGVPEPRTEVVLPYADRAAGA